jgi:hypothetical protein
MMAEKVELLVQIGADGRVKIETHGLHGEECVQETKDLLPALGTVTRREKTSEYYRQSSRAKTVTRAR